MDLFRYDNSLRHERVKVVIPLLNSRIYSELEHLSHHVDSTLKRRGKDHFHVVSTWNPRGVFVGYTVNTLAKLNRSLSIKVKHLNLRKMLQPLLMSKSHIYFIFFYCKVLLINLVVLGGVIGSKVIGNLITLRKWWNYFFFIKNKFATSRNILSLCSILFY